MIQIFKDWELIRSANDIENEVDAVDDGTTCVGDVDGDGVEICLGDCDDSDPILYPGSGCRSGSDAKDRKH